MAQVNSSPGQNQALGTKAVAAGVLQLSAAIRNTATLTTVSSNQSHVGSKTTL